MNIQSKMIAAILCAGSLPCAFAADFEDYAHVVSVSPQVEQVNRPHQECRTEYVQVERQERSGRSVGGAIIGGLAGAALGNQVGGGTGRSTATAVGAIAGALVGDRVDNNGNNGGTVSSSEQPVRQCRTVDRWESRTNGYAVTYEYRGHTYTSVMPYDPGQRLKVNVSVVPRP